MTFVAPAAEGATWRVRTYERGVEAETLSCGTGILAAACVVAGTAPVLSFRPKSDDLQRVRFPEGADSKELWAEGPVRLVAQGAETVHQCVDGTPGRSFYILIDTDDQELGVLEFAGTLERHTVGRPLIEEAVDGPQESGRFGL